MPRLSHSSRQTRTTLQASGRPGAPALGDGLSDRSELAAEVCGGCTVLSAWNKGARLALLTTLLFQGLGKNDKQLPHRGRVASREIRMCWRTHVGSRVEGGLGAGGFWACRKGWCRKRLPL